MDAADAVESAEPAKACEKRAAAAAEDGEFGARRKRMRNGGASEAEMRRIAEIVLVLSTMGAMRGGRDPTPQEKAMMAEARAMAVSICEDLAPKDVLPREAFGGIIEDLGLNKLKEQRLNFRPPKLSIVEKMESTKRRMRELKSFAAQAAVDQTQRAHVGVDNHGMPTAVHPFSSDKTRHVQASAATFQHLSPYMSSASSTTLRFQPPTTQVRSSLVSTGLPNSNLGRDSSSTTSRVDIPHLGSDGRVNGPSHAPHVPTGFTVKTTAALQPLFISSSNISTKTKPPEYSPVKIEGYSNLHVRPLNSQATNVQTISSVFTQVVPGTLPSMRHPIQGTQFVHAAHHLEISKIVQKLLHPKPAERPAWSPPSRDYMSKSVTCQTCKLATKEIDNTYVCDACGKGFHSKCLQPVNQKFVSRGEWYCPRCMTVSGGKPFPPKFGRVTRNLVATNITSNSPGLQFPLDKRIEAEDQNAYEQKIVAVGDLDERNGHQGGPVAESPEAKTMQTNKINGRELSAAIKKEEIPISETCLDKNPAPVRVSCVSSYAKPLENGPIQHVLRRESSLCKDELKTEGRDCASACTSGLDASKYLHPSSSHNIDHGTEAFSAEVAPEQNKDASQLYDHSEKSSGTKSDDCSPTCSFKEGDRDAEQEKQTGTAGVSTELQDSAKGSAAIHHVDWIGNVSEVVENKKFYQSCQINGAVYKLQDYALIHQSSNGKLIPWKLQAMWEDSHTGSRWVAVNRCYYPGDLPATVGHPSAPEGNEVYESNDESTLMAGLIEGPCIILPAKNYGETDQIGDQQSDGGWPVLSCRWFYDKIKGVFRPVPG